MYVLLEEIQMCTHPEATVMFCFDLKWLSSVSG